MSEEQPKKKPEEISAEMPMYFDGRAYWKDPEHSWQFYEQKAAAAEWERREGIKRTRKAAEQARNAYEAKTLRRVAGLVVVVLLAGGAFALWNYMNESGYIYHDKMTTVYFHSWLAGEYKPCTSLNLKEEDTAPEIHCDLSEGLAEGKVFKVRFYAKTYTKDKQEGIVHYWKCRKNGESDPAMTCELQESK